MAPKRPIKRVFKGEEKVLHDLFYLKSADYLRNVSYSDAYPTLEKHSHVHWFHSVDSNGRKMTHCEAVGGHKHAITIGVDEKTDMLVATCGPAEGLKWDKHTHVVEYRRSEPLVSRKIVPEAYAAFERATNPLQVEEA